MLIHQYPSLSNTTHRSKYVPPAVITSEALQKLGLYAGGFVTVELIEDALQQEPESQVQERPAVVATTSSALPMAGRQRNAITSARSQCCVPGRLPPAGRHPSKSIHLQGRVAPLSVQLHVSSGPAGQGTSRRVGFATMMASGNACARCSQSIVALACEARRSRCCHHIEPQRWCASPCVRALASMAGAWLQVAIERSPLSATRRVPVFRTDTPAYVCSLSAAG